MSICQKEYRWLCERLTKKLSSVRHPVSGTFELTWDCNFHCAHCYLKGYRSEDRLDSTSVIRMLEDMAEDGCLGLVLTGGEPLCHPDFRKIYGRAVRLGFLVTLFTNGSLIDNQTADFLADHPPRCVELTLYGGDEESYRTVTKTRGNFSRVLDGLDRLLERGISVVPKAMLLRPLLGQVDKLRELTKVRELSIRIDPIIDPTLAGDMEPLAYRLDPEEAVGIEMDDPERLEKLGPYDEMWRKISPGMSESACLAGFSSFHIDPRGQLMPCLQLREPMVPMLPEGFAAAWQRLGSYRRPRYDESSLCGRCDLTHLCGYCPGLLQLGEAPPVDGDGYHCRIARARAMLVRSNHSGDRREVA